MDKLVYLIYPAMLVILLVGSKWYRKGEWNETFMSLDQTKYLQGYIAICIMLHHIGQETCASWQRYKLLPGLELFVPVGYFFVAFFFLCSGFGLYKSYMQKENYLDGFIKRRVFPLIVAFLVSGWIFFIARIIMKEPMDGWKIFCYISGWGLPNLYSWFMIAIVIFYLVFYLSFKYIPKESMKILGVFLGVFLYTFIGTCIDHNNYWMRGEWWYNCVHLFWIGILFAKYESKVVEKARKKYWLYLILSVVLMYVFFVTSQIVNGVVSYYGEYNWSLSRFQVVRNRWICLSVEGLACLCFVIVVVLLNMKLKVGNRLLNLMGTITLEFYLIHGLFLEFFSYRFCDMDDVASIVRIENVALLTVIVFACSVPAALGFRKLRNLTT